MAQQRQVFATNSNGSGGAPLWGTGIGLVVAARGGLRARRLAMKAARPAEPWAGISVARASVREGPRAHRV